LHFGSHFLGSKNNIMSLEATALWPSTKQQKVATKQQKVATNKNNKINIFPPFVRYIAIA